jgi:hypothetical protein
VPCSHFLYECPLLDQQMDKHALAILSQDNFWSWSNTKRIQGSGKQSGNLLEGITHKFLYYLILESQTFGGNVLDLFWTQLANCNRRFRDNSESKLNCSVK